MKPIMHAGEARRLLAAMRGRRVTVVGDAMLDRYLRGVVERVSPEAPVPVMRVAIEEDRLGGAANVACCLRSVGAEVRLCTVIGNDSEAAQLSDLARAEGVHIESVLRDNSRPTTCKTRVVAGTQQLVRFDREACLPVSGECENLLIREMQEALRWSEVLVLTDYSKGVLTERVCTEALRLAAHVPTIIDPKRLPWDRFRGATVIKPNACEIGSFFGVQIDGDESAAQMARKLAARLEVAHVLITRGHDGMTLRNSDGEVCHLRARPRRLIDVTGAGDVVTAYLALAIAAGANVAEAAGIANIAAGVKVSKFGTASVSAQEIIAESYAEACTFDAKVMTREVAADWARGLREQRRRVVFTNGCFDILHVGHVTYLQKSRALGDALVVGLNSDSSIRRLKGEQRPIQSELDRARIMASQSCVDAVVIFDEDTPIELIREIHPDVLTKGTDYETKDRVVGWDLVESWGGETVLIDLVPGRSTTGLIGKQRPSG